MTDRGIAFAHGVPWVALSQQETARLARDERSGFTHAQRVWLLALGRCNAIGHAQFAPGEIAKALATVNVRTGEMTPLPANRVSEAIRDARARGLLGDESRARCLVLPHYAVQRGKGDRRCRVHGVPV